jgi:hypothetical protein
MDKWLCEFQKDLSLLVPTLVLGVFLNAFNSVTLLDLEKRLGRKLTDWDSQYLTREAQRRVEADSRQEIARQRLKRSDDMKIIHDFVWDRG